jgi:hypothetical protein
VRGISIILLVILGQGVAPSTNAAQASDIEWVVQNPFRFYKKSKSFQLHENAYKAVRGTPESPRPNNIIQLVERCLNDPTSIGFPVDPACADLSRKLLPEVMREGWAARTVGDVCYERGKREYPITCEREHDGRMEQEDYILPQSHTVEIWLTEKVLAEEKNGNCEWQWSERADPSRKTTRTAPCGEKVVINKVPFALKPASSGIDVTVKLSSGRIISEPGVAVDDRLVVSLGDSFSSGEGNPDRPVKFSSTKALDYKQQREPVIASSSSAKVGPMPPPITAPGGGGFDPYVLPRRELDFEPDPGSDAFNKEFSKHSAGWLSANCHRSQYGYPVRVALELALEDRHRAITFVHLGCSGAEVTEGLLASMDAREGISESPKVSPQLSQLTDLLCSEGSQKSQREPFTLPVFVPGETGYTSQSFAFKSCKGKLKRPIDVVMLSIGGNDVGFSALGAYVIVNSLGDIAWVGRFVDSKMRYGPGVADARLNVLDRRIQALKLALKDDFAVDPSKVIHTSYERIQEDEAGKLCGTYPRLGMDVHDKFSFHTDHLKDTADFLGRLLASLRCMTNKAKAEGDGIHCRDALKTGEGTKFTLVVDHQAEFMKRGICARGPGDGDGGLMQIPRYDVGEFKPYNPADFHPYASRTRLFRTPNDAFLTANTHREGQTLIIDIIQPAFAALYSGAIHPTAQAHSIVADYVFNEVSRVLKENP